MRNVPGQEYLFCTACPQYSYYLLANCYLLFYYESMISLSIKPQRIQGLQIKKGVLGASDSFWSEKVFEKRFIEDGKFVSVEQLTSALKETLSVNGRLFKDTDVTLVLDATVYTLFRTDIPLETDKTAYHVFLKEQFLSQHKIDAQDYVLEMFVREFENKKIGFVYALPRAQLDTVAQALALLDFKLVNVVPEHLAYFTTFERTLRLDKQEYILYVTYEGKDVSGLVYDTYGPLTEIEPWTKKNVPLDGLEAFLHQKAHEASSKVAKLNRMVISGTDSDKIRQDTFTKNVGVWTNPLKRIIPNFYKEYVTMIQGKNEGTMLFPVLTYSGVFGAFVSSQENKAFPYVKMGTKQKAVSYEKPVTYSPNAPMNTNETIRKFRFPKEILLFVVIFAVTFGVFYLIANGRSGNELTLPFAAGPTETPTPEPTEPPPTPTPTIEVQKDTVSIQVLNGTGVPGQANGVKTLLSEKGYTTVTTENALNFGYVQSEIQINPEKAYLKDVILADVSDLLTDPKVTDLPAEETVDVIIIIGSDAN